MNRSSVLVGGKSGREKHKKTENMNDIISKCDPTDKLLELYTKQKIYLSYTRGTYRKTDQSYKDLNKFSITDIIQGTNIDHNKINLEINNKDNFKIFHLP